ncbi:hypothetical protein GCM10009759_44590 [Kitasatospora saccharophila]|uniref:Uncharacterized protein n=1 Tax=Kitasatospora saccharophila TaxID=407973 RepID=A0ABN2X758_9ACTN
MAPVVGGPAGPVAPARVRGSPGGAGGRELLSRVRAASGAGPPVAVRGLPVLPFVVGEGTALRVVAGVSAVRRSPSFRLPPPSVRSGRGSPGGPPGGRSGPEHRSAPNGLARSPVRATLPSVVGNRV